MESDLRNPEETNKSKHGARERGKNFPSTVLRKKKNCDTPLFETNSLKEGAV
jgi:hypothetical protein